MAQQTEQQQSNQRVEDAAASLNIPREYVNDPSRGLTPLERFRQGHDAPLERFYRQHDAPLERCYQQHDAPRHYLPPQQQQYQQQQQRR